MGDWLELFPEVGSTLADDVDRFWFFLIGLSTFFILLIAGLELYFSIRYRRRSEDEIPLPVRSSVRLEVLWVVIPFVLSMGIFAWGASLYYSIIRVPDEALEIYVVGKQWMWKVQHLEGNREINELHVPVGRKVKLIMTSQDVIHSFYIPAFRLKQDVLPGRYTTLWFEATRPGEYHLFCAEYCGTEHSKMIGRVVAMEPQEYDQWLGGLGAGETMAEAGERLFNQNGCTSCHLADGNGIGPSLVGIFGTEAELEGGGTALVDEAYLRESILNPQAKIVAGYQPVMSSYDGIISEGGVLQIITYIKSLSDVTE